jgi:hypothetical protein
VSGVEPNGKVSGSLVLSPSASFARGGTVHRFELFVDGRRTAVARAGQTLTWDSTTDYDGYHELRVVAVADGPIATQGRAILPVVVDNHGRTATMTATPAETVRWDETLLVDVKAPGMKQVYVLNNGRMVGVIPGEQGQLKIPPAALGIGPVGLQGLGVAGAGYGDRVVLRPIQLSVAPPAPLPALPVERNLAGGMLLRLPDNRIVPVQSTADPGWLALHGVGPKEPYAIQGIFDVDADDVYQFQLWHHGELTLPVDDKTLYTAREGDYTLKYVPVPLAKGQHRLIIGGRTGGDTKLRILFGGPGAQSLNGSRFRHVRQGR